MVQRDRAALQELKIESLDRRQWRARRRRPFLSEQSHELRLRRLRSGSARLRLRFRRYLRSCAWREISTGALCVVAMDGSGHSVEIGKEPPLVDADEVELIAEAADFL